MDIFPRKVQLAGGGKSLYHEEHLSETARPAQSVDSVDAEQCALPSIGSGKHATGDCKTCYFFVKSKCKKGTNCEFCHICTEQKPVPFKKGTEGEGKGEGKKRKPSTEDKTTKGGKSEDKTTKGGKSEEKTAKGGKSGKGTENTKGGSTKSKKSSPAPPPDPGTEEEILQNAPGYYVWHNLYEPAVSNNNFLETAGKEPEKLLEPYTSVHPREYWKDSRTRFREFLGKKFEVAEKRKIAMRCKGPRPRRRIIELPQWPLKVITNALWEQVELTEAQQYTVLNDHRALKKTFSQLEKGFHIEVTNFTECFGLQDNDMSEDPVWNVGRVDFTEDEAEASVEVEQFLYKARLTAEERQKALEQVTPMTAEESKPQEAVPAVLAAANDADDLPDFDEKMTQEIESNSNAESAKPGIAASETTAVVFEKEDEVMAIKDSATMAIIDTGASQTILTAESAQILSAKQYLTEIQDCHKSFSTANGQGFVTRQKGMLKVPPLCDHEAFIAGDESGLRKNLIGAPALRGLILELREEGPKLKSSSEEVDLMTAPNGHFLMNLVKEKDTTGVQAQLSSSSSSRTVDVVAKARSMLTRAKLYKR